MTLDDETAARIAREVIGGGRAARVYPHSTDVALVRAGYAARDAEVEELRADLDAAAYRAGQYQARIALAESTLAKVREWAESIALQPDPPADDEMVGQINAAGDVLVILDESPTDREREHFHIWSELPCKPGECRMEGSPERETPADEWVYSVGGRNSDGSVWCDEDEVTPDIDEAREWVEEALESGTFANACLVRRRKQVWEVCDE